MTALIMGLSPPSSRKSPNIDLVLVICLNAILSLAFKSRPTDSGLVFWYTSDQTQGKPVGRWEIWEYSGHVSVPILTVCHHHPGNPDSELCFALFFLCVFFLTLKLYFIGKWWFDELFCLIVLPYILVPKSCCTVPFF